MCFRVHCTHVHVHAQCIVPFLIQLSQFRSGTTATGPIDPTDLSQRLSSLPLEDNTEGGGGEEEGESAALFGVNDSRLYACTCTYMYMYIHSAMHVN